MKKTLTCIECPRGCALTVEEINGEFVVTGNSCPKGAVYGKNEVTNPVRIVTSTVRSADGKLIPVKTSKAVSKKLIFNVMEKIRSVTVLTNLEIGDIIIENVDGNGANIVSSAKYVKGERYD